MSTVQQRDVARMMNASAAVFHTAGLVLLYQSLETLEDGGYWVYWLFVIMATALQAFSAYYFASFGMRERHRGVTPGFILSLLIPLLFGGCLFWSGISSYSSLANYLIPDDRAVPLLADGAFSVFLGVSGVFFFPLADVVRRSVESPALRSGTS